MALFKKRHDYHFNGVTASFARVKYADRNDFPHIELKIEVENPDSPTGYSFIYLDMTLFEANRMASDFVLHVSGIMKDYELTRAVRVPWGEGNGHG